MKIRAYAGIQRAIRLGVEGNTNTRRDVICWGSCDVETEMPLDLTYIKMSLNLVRCLNFDLDKPETVHRARAYVPSEPLHSHYHDKSSERGPTLSGTIKGGRTIVN